MTGALENLIDRFIPMLGIGVIGFAVAMLLTPVYTYFAYRYEWWKLPRRESITGEKAVKFYELHAHKHRRLIPTMAGVITLASIAVITVTLNLSREQTYLPLAAVLGGGLIGLIDDIINIRGSGKGIAGLRSSRKLVLLLIVALLGGLYFYYKLDYSSLAFPFVDGRLELGWLIVPVFGFVILATANAVNITDGLDGLAGGLLASAFGAFGIIAFMQGNYGIARFCMTLAGVMLAYTWFNLYPARFFMGDVGSFAMGAGLGVIAMLTDSVFILPIIGGVFVVEAASSLLQITSKRLLKRKIFRVAPLHHHLEAIGWPETKVTMRFWIIGQVLALGGIVVAILGGLI
jgi:phospho-N-acetylmuramoyl-pentapeptide-transferase